MEIRRDHPEVLNEFEAAPAARVRGWTWFCLGLWLALLGGDWAARLGVFRWQDQWLLPRRSQVSSTPAAAPAEFQSRQIPPQTGAGLTKMVPIPWVAARYAEFHPGYEQPRDEFGYFNAPLPPGSRWRIVMLGDSFMVSLGTQNVAQVLASLGNVPVYNHAKPGAGPVMEMQHFIFSDRFKPLPQVAIWNLTARELGGSLFLRQSVDEWFRGINAWAPYIEKMNRSWINWYWLQPAVLNQTWPNTSVLAYFSRQTWAQAKLLAFGAWPRDVLGAEDPQFGPMLFYRENLRTLPELTPEKDAPAVVQTVAKIAQGLQARGVKLVVLLVPEKEQVHVNALSAADRRALARGPELLGAIATGLEAQGVPVVNLLPVFQQATAAGQRLYWRDDTHWNDAGIRLAAEELWRKVAPLLERTPESISNDQVLDR